MPRAGAKDASRRSPKWQARREAIIDTSARVFARRGYHATGISDTQYELRPRFRESSRGFVFTTLVTF